MKVKYIFFSKEIFMGELQGCHHALMQSGADVLHKDPNPNNAKIGKLREEALEKVWVNYIHTQLSYSRYFNTPQTLEFIFSPLILQQMKHHQTKHIIWERIWWQGKKHLWDSLECIHLCSDMPQLWRNTTLSSLKHTSSLHPPSPPKTQQRTNCNNSTFPSSKTSENKNNNRKSNNK